MYSSTSSAGARIALVFITLGSLLVVWTIVWYSYLLNNRPLTNSPYYWCGGLLLTGIVFLCVGFGTGRIGYAARQADNPATTIIAAPDAAPLQNQPVDVVVTDKEVRQAPTPPSVVTQEKPGKIVLN